ncbi:hypothetical protein ACQKMD_16780 [Viridibacillus sp. NPDC096237]|uniref:hypothetical protein n=1 Tax=Viridibacillus sp. NPDC096237 TaxID=3390721 RepID=UPI003D017978
MKTILYTRDQEVIMYDPQQTVCEGPSATWFSRTISVSSDKLVMIALDFACSVALTVTGEVRKSQMIIVVKNVDTGKIVERMKVRGSRTWTRAFFPLDHGNYQIGFITDENYRNADKVYMKDFYYHDYIASPNIDAIGSLKPPKQLAGIQTFDTLEGTMRLQRIGNKGCEIEMTLYFKTETQYRNFVRSRHDSYMVLECNYGVYGGYLAGTESDPSTDGPLRLIRVKLLSPQRAGVGVDGM